MKKRLIILIFTIITIFSLVGCNNQQTSQSIDDTTIDDTNNPEGTSDSNMNKYSAYKDLNTSNRDMSAEEYNSFYRNTALTYFNFIDMPDYKNLDITFPAFNTQKSVDEYIDEILASYKTKRKLITGVTKNGDSIVLNYSGKINGQAFQGGSATDVTYTIGSGKFVSDLDKGLVGLNVGETYSISCTYPNNYSATELRGKTVVFEVTVTAINTDEYVIPELTDEWVAKHSYELGISENTVEGFRNYVLQYLEDSDISDYNDLKYSAIISRLQEQTPITEYPLNEETSLISIVQNNFSDEYDKYKNQSPEYNSTSLWTYLKDVYNLDIDNSMDFNNYIYTYVENYLYEKMIVTLIAYDNNITVNAGEIKETGEQMAEYYGYSDFDDIIKSVGSEINAEIGYQLLSEKVKNLLTNTYYPN